MLSKRYAWTLIIFFFVQNGQTQVPVKTYKGDSVTVVADRDRYLVRSNTVALKMPMDNRLIPASVHVITSALADLQHNLTLSEAVQNVAGVNRQSGHGVHDYFMIRGFNSLDNGLILSNGAPEPEATIHDLYDIEQIQVLKGPGAFLYGGYPLAASVNLVYKRPRFQRFTTVTSGYGSFQTMRHTLDAGWANAASTVAMRLNGLLQQSDGYRDDKSSKVSALHPSFLWRPNKNHQVHLDVEYVHNRYSPDTGLPLLYNPLSGQLDQLPDIDRKTNFQSSQDDSRQDIYRFKSEYVREAVAGGQMRLSLFHTDQDWNSKGTLVNGAYPTPMGSYMVSRTLPLLHDRQKVSGLQWQWNRTLETGALGHKLVFAFDYTRWSDQYRYDVIPQLSPLDLNHPTAEGNTLPMAYPYLKGNSVTTNIAPYVLDMVTLAHRLNIMVGGRFDYLQSEDTERKQNSTFKPFSPILGVLWDIGGNQSIYAQYGRAFAPPSTLSTAALQPEEARQKEVGVKSALFNKNLEANFAVYELEKTNIAIPDQSGVTKQNGDQRSRGVEVELVFQPQSRWLTTLQYAWCDAELVRFREAVAVGQDQYGQPIMMTFDRSGHHPVFAPAHLAGFWSSYEWPFGFGVGFGVRYAGEQYIDEDNVVRLEPYTVVDAQVFARWKLLRWQLHFKNITNSKYWLRGNGGFSVTPAAPFAVYSNLELALGR
jgi:iron complex outermembrane recepter protein